VAQSVEALRYKPEGREFDSRWCHCNFSLNGVDSASDRNEGSGFYLYSFFTLGARWGRFTRAKDPVPIV